MKFVSVSLIKDEADIIELFIRINSRVIDHFFIVDNGSTDYTLKILERLRAEGFNITIYSDPNANYDQAEMTTKALRTASRSTKFDWAFCLDADEFINIPKKELEKELSSIDVNVSVASLKWSTWVPKGDSYYSYDNPLWSCFERKLEENTDYSKVVIPYTLAYGSVMVDMGNHNAYIMFNDGSYNIYESRKIMTHNLTCGKLDHVPVRSSKQIKAKIIIGETKLSIKKSRKPYEGYHWKNAYRLIKSYGYKIDDVTVRYLAVNYLTRQDQSVVDEVHPTDRLGFESDRIKYRNLSDFNSDARLFNYIETLATQLREKS